MDKKEKIIENLKEVADFAGDYGMIEEAKELEKKISRLASEQKACDMREDAITNEEQILSSCYLNLC